MNDFEIWDKEMHSTEDQLKRQKSASESCLTPLSIENSIGIFKGTKNDYITSLKDCTCIDFMRRKMPCKHMYRLAHELNKFTLKSISSDANISIRKRIDDIMPVIESMSEDYQIEFKNIAYICGNDGKSEGVVVKDINVARTFIELHLAQKVTDKYKLLKYMNINLVRKIIPDNGIKLPRKKDEIIQFILSTYPNIEIPDENDRIHIELDKSISHLGYSIHKRLCTKFPNEDEDFSAYFL